MSASIKKGDMVQVIAGRDKKVRGKVLRILDDGRLIVEKVHTVMRHQGPRKYRETGIQEMQAPIHASNVMLIDPKTDKPTRTRAGQDKKDANKKVRIAVKSGEVIA